VIVPLMLASFVMWSRHRATAGAARQAATQGANQPNRIVRRVLTELCNLSDNFLQEKP